MPYANRPATMDDLDPETRARINATMARGSEPYAPGHIANYSAAGMAPSSPWNQGQPDTGFSLNRGGTSDQDWDQTPTTRQPPGIMNRSAAGMSSGSPWNGGTTIPGAPPAAAALPAPGATPPVARPPVTAAPLDTTSPIVPDPLHPGQTMATRNLAGAAVHTPKPLLNYEQRAIVDQHVAALQTPAMRGALPEPGSDPVVNQSQANIQRNMAATAGNEFHTRLAQLRSGGVDADARRTAADTDMVLNTLDVANNNRLYTPGRSSASNVGAASGAWIRPPAGATPTISPEAIALARGYGGAGTLAGRGIEGPSPTLSAGQRMAYESGRDTRQAAGDAALHNDAMDTENDSQRLAAANARTRNASDDAMMHNWRRDNMMDSGQARTAQLNLPPAPNQPTPMRGEDPRNFATRMAAYQQQQGEFNHQRFLATPGGQQAYEREFALRHSFAQNGYIPGETPLQHSQRARVDATTGLLGARTDRIENPVAPAPRTGTPHLVQERHPLTGATDGYHMSDGSVFYDKNMNEIKGKGLKGRNAGGEAPPAPGSEKPPGAAAPGSAAPSDFRDAPSGKAEGDTLKKGGKEVARWTGGRWVGI